MAIVIPQTNGRSGKTVLIAKSAETGWSQQKKSAASRSNTQPAPSQHADKVPTRKEQNVARHAPDALDDTLGAFADLCGRFTLGSPITEEVPVRVSLSDLR